MTELTMSGKGMVTRDGLDRALHKVFLTKQLYLGLVKSEAGDESTAQGYFRQPVMFSAPHDSQDGKVRIVSNANVILYPYEVVAEATGWFLTEDPKAPGGERYTKIQEVTPIAGKGDEESPFGGFRVGDLTVGFAMLMEGS